MLEKVIHDTGEFVDFFFSYFFLDLDTVVADFISLTKDSYSWTDRSMDGWTRNLIFPFSLSLSLTYILFCRVRITIVKSKTGLIACKNPIYCVWMRWFNLSEGARAFHTCVITIILSIVNNSDRKKRKKSFHSYIFPSVTLESEMKNDLSFPQKSLFSWYKFEKNVNLEKTKWLHA